MRAEADEGGAPSRQGFFHRHKETHALEWSRVTRPAPRCVVPTLEHGQLGRAPHALRTPATENRVDALVFGTLPCAGAYLAVIDEGAIRAGAPVSLTS
jgi:hypothetical protein